MKPLIVTNHSLEQYASRTGRNQFSCVAELINSVRCSTSLKFNEAREIGFNLTRQFKGDTYQLWYDPKIDDQLLAIVAADGAIKTVLRKEMYSYRVNSKERYDTKGGCYHYDHESTKRKANTRMR